MAHSGTNGISTSCASAKLDLAGLINLSKLEEALRVLAADHISADGSRTAQETKIFALQSRVDGVEQGQQEVVGRLIPELAKQIEGLIIQSKALEEEKCRLRVQEAQLTRQAGRLQQLETEMDARMAALEQKISRVEQTSSQQYGEVKEEINEVRSGHNVRTGPTPEQLQAEQLRREQEYQEHLREQEEAKERARQRKLLEEQWQREEDEAVAAAKAAEEQVALEVQAKEQRAAALASLASSMAPAPLQAVRLPPPGSAPVAAAAPAEDPEAGLESLPIQGGAGGRLKRLDAAQLKLYKLSKKKLKEIDALQAQLTAKTVRYKDLSDEQKEKLNRRAELEQTVADLDRVAEELEEAANNQEEALVEETEVSPKDEAEEEAPEPVQEEVEEVHEETPEEAAARAEREAEEAAAALEAEKQALLKQRKAIVKKLKEIQALEAKMEMQGQTFEDLLPEVKQKVSKKGDLEHQVAQIDLQLEALENKETGETAQEEEQVQEEAEAEVPVDAAEDVMEAPAEDAAQAAEEEEEEEEEEAPVRPRRGSGSKPSSKQQAKGKKGSKKGKRGDNDENQAPKPGVEKKGSFLGGLFGL